MPPEHIEQAALFLEFVGKHHDTFLKYAQNLCKNKDEAADLVQDSILKSHDAIKEKGFVQNDFSLYLFQRIKWTFHMSRRDKKIALPLSDHLHVADSDFCNNKVDALALSIDVYVSAHYDSRHVMWFQLHLKGLTYEEIGFGDNVQAPRVCKVIKKIKAEVRLEFKRRVLELGSD